MSTAHQVPGADDLLGICGVVTHLRRRVGGAGSDRRATTVLLLLDEAASRLTAAALAIERGELLAALAGVRRGRAALRLADEAERIRPGIGRYDRVERGRSPVREALDPDIGQVMRDLVFVADDLDSSDSWQGEHIPDDRWSQPLDPDHLAPLVLAAGEELRELAGRAPADDRHVREREVVTLALLRLASEHAVGAAEAEEFDGDHERAQRQLEEVDALVAAGERHADGDVVRRLREALEEAVAED